MDSCHCSIGVHPVLKPRMKVERAISANKLEKKERVSEKERVFCEIERKKKNRREEGRNIEK